MPMPNPTGDPAFERNFWTRPQTIGLLVIAAIAFVAAIVALVVALSAKPGVDDAAKKGAGLHPDGIPMCQVVVFFAPMT